MCTLGVFLDSSLQIAALDSKTFGQIYLVHQLCLYLSLLHLLIVTHRLMTSYLVTTIHSNMELAVKTIGSYSWQCRM